MTLDEVLEFIERDRGPHVLGLPATTADIATAEQTLGVRFPAPFAQLLTHFSGGLLFRHHELCGTRGVIVHDIELVHDLGAFRRMLESKGVVEHDSAARLLPFHLCDDRVHAFELDSGGIVELRGKASYADLPSFLEAVVLKS